MIKKLISTSLFFLLISIGNLYISAYFHTLLMYDTLYSPVLSISGFMETFSYVTNGNANAFFLLLEVSTISMIIYILYLQHSRNLSSDVRTITPDIITPVEAGHGEYGTARWQSDREKTKIFGYIRLPFKKSILEYIKELKISREKQNIKNRNENKIDTSDTD